MAYYVGKILKSSEEVWAMYEVLYVFLLLISYKGPVFHVISNHYIRKKYLLNIGVEYSIFSYVHYSRVNRLLFGMFIHG